MCVIYVCHVETKALYAVCNSCLRRIHCFRADRAISLIYFYDDFTIRYTRDFIRLLQVIISKISNLLKNKTNE